MADRRTIYKFPVGENAAALHASIAQLLTAQKYHEIMYTKHNVNEVVWRKGDGFWTAFQYIKLDYQPNELVISAWVAINLDVLTDKETPLEGIMGFAPKNSTKKTVEKIGQMAQASVAGAQG